MQRELKEMPGALKMAGGDDPELTYFVNNMTVPDVDFFLHQLKIVDNAACSWLSMLKVFIDFSLFHAHWYFQGFTLKAVSQTLNLHPTHF